MTAHPTLPFVRSSDTSAEAAERAWSWRATGKGRVLLAIQRLGVATDEQIELATGMNPSTIRPRRVELAREGAIVRHPVDGRTASGRRAARWTVA